MSTSDGNDNGNDADDMNAGRALVRALLGSALATFFGWLFCVLGFSFAGLILQPVADPLSAFVVVLIIFGMGGIISFGPTTFFIGVPLWLVFDRLTKRPQLSGAIAGGAVGTVMAFFIPPVSYVLPFAGALSGFLAVRYTNKLVPRRPRRAPPGDPKTPALPRSVNGRSDP